MNAGNPATIVDWLVAHAARPPEHAALIFLADGETEDARWSYGDLDRRARGVAGLLAAYGIAPGDRVLLPFPAGLDFAAAFFGCLYAGAVAVPVPAPHPRRLDAEQSRTLAVARDCGARLVLTVGHLAPSLARILSADQATAGLPCVPVDGATDAPPWTGPPRARPQDLAFLQYTSGSTALPKGVMVSHANLIANSEMIRRICAHTAATTVVTWLPMYHDMGLIGTMVHPLHLGATSIQMPPIAFLQRPVRWLRAIARYRGRTTTAPNFAYDWCVRQIEPGAEDDIDLSCWTIAFNGGEPVRAGTLEAFATRFAPCGIRAEALCPTYGLAETTLLATADTPGVRPTVRRLDGPALDRGDVIDVAHDASDAREIVSCGPAASGRRVAIVDLVDGAEVAAGRVGEIWLAGADIARGYWNRPEESAATFGARLPSGEGPFLRTGDLGFVDAGLLYVTGRLKDLIIVGGQNYYPQDLELSVEGAHPAVRLAGAAAFAVEVDAEERPVAVVEVRRDLGGAPPEQIVEAITGSIVRRHGLPLHDVVLVRAGGVPRTSSGKVRRSACRDLYRSGALPTVFRMRA